MTHHIDVLFGKICVLLISDNNLTLIPLKLYKKALVYKNGH